MAFRCGKLPARLGAIAMQFDHYFSAAELPVPPPVFGRPWLVNSWGILANDVTGDCVFAGAAHETMLWRAEVGDTVSFNDATVLSDYSVVTGYAPDDPSTDNGTDMQVAASYRRKTGIVDASGTRHTIDSYVALEPGNIDQITLAAYLTGAVGIGLRLPQSAEDQFDRAEPWDVVAGSPFAGGHYVPCVGRNSHGNLLVITWGRLQAVTPAFISAFMDEGVAYLSLEPLRNNVSPRGFDEAALQSDLQQLTGGSTT